ncbi:hypothetical protein BHE74_00023522 [Ensete ventricosum]|nr:hypothetical protein BHE74_00023522 [Ensete ventricosum]
MITPAQAVDGGLRRSRSGVWSVLGLLDLSRCPSFVPDLYPRRSTWIPLYCSVLAFVWLSPTFRTPISILELDVIFRGSPLNILGFFWSCEDFGALLAFDSIWSRFLLFF